MYDLTTIQLINEIASDGDKHPTDPKSVRELGIVIEAFASFRGNDPILYLDALAKEIPPPSFWKFKQMKLNPIAIIGIIACLVAMLWALVYQSDKQDAKYIRLASRVDQIERATFEENSSCCQTGEDNGELRKVVYSLCKIILNLQERLGHLEKFAAEIQRKVAVE